MPTHPLWSPYQPVDLAAAAATLLGRPNVTPVTVVEYDDGWPRAFVALRSVIVDALGPLAITVAHVGSPVPGLAAKPVIDVDLTVPDSADEAAYVPALEAAGFELRRREPEWEEHRLLTADAPARANLHVWSPGAIEPRRHLAFRDWLRAHPDDRAAYAAVKAELGARGFVDGNDYNNHKAGFVYDLYERIFAADPEHEHTLQPRGTGEADPGRRTARAR